MTTAIVAGLSERQKSKQVNIIYPILVPPLGKLPVEKGQQGYKGDPSPKAHEILTRFSSLLAQLLSSEYFVENLQSVLQEPRCWTSSDKHV